jgi:imidazolonepropionase-like amidohydrolase
VRMLRQLAGIAAANGLSPTAALAAVTTVPARLFGLDRGRIRTGAVADLGVWSGDPFELSTRAEHVIIAGKEQGTRTRQTLLFERYRKLPSR